MSAEHKIVLGSDIGSFVSGIKTAGDQLKDFQSIIEQVSKAASSLQSAQDIQKQIPNLSDSAAANVQQAFAAAHKQAMANATEIRNSLQSQYNFKKTMLEQLSAEHNGLKDLIADEKELAKIRELHQASMVRYKKDLAGLNVDIGALNAAIGQPGIGPKVPVGSTSTKETPEETASRQAMSQLQKMGTTEVLATMFKGGPAGMIGGALSLLGSAGPTGMAAAAAIGFTAAAGKYASAEDALVTNAMRSEYTGGQYGISPENMMRSIIRQKGLGQYGRFAREKPGFLENFYENISFTKDYLLSNFNEDQANRQFRTRLLNTTGAEYQEESQGLSILHNRAQQYYNQERMFGTGVQSDVQGWTAAGYSEDKLQRVMPGLARYGNRRMDIGDIDITGSQVKYGVSDLAQQEMIRRSPMDTTRSVDEMRRLYSIAGLGAGEGSFLGRQVFSELVGQRSAELGVDPNSIFGVGRMYAESAKSYTEALGKDTRLKSPDIIALSGEATNAILKQQQVAMDPSRIAMMGAMSKMGVKSVADMQLMISQGHMETPEGREALAAYLNKGKKTTDKDYISAEKIRANFAAADEKTWKAQTAIWDQGGTGQIEAFYKQLTGQSGITRGTAFMANAGTAAQTGAYKTTRERGGLFKEGSGAYPLGAEGPETNEEKRKQAEALSSSMLVQEFNRVSVSYIKALELNTIALQNQVTATRTQKNTSNATMANPDSVFTQTPPLESAKNATHPTKVSPGRLAR